MHWKRERDMGEQWFQISNANEASASNRESKRSTHCKLFSIYAFPNIQLAKPHSQISTKYFQARIIIFYPEVCYSLKK
jgi:hypothetical protein